jgi:hypothetical protein
MNCKSQDCTREQLLAMEDEALLLYFSQVERDSIVAEEVARVYLERGRMQKDTIKMARGYDRLARIFHPEKNIQFSDSLIELTKNMNNITYPGLGYILKGYLFYELDEVNLGNINFFKAYDLAKKSNNITQQSYILNCLAFYKLLYGNKEEALKLQQEQHQIIISEKFEIEIIKSTRSSAAHLVKNFHMSEKIHSFLMLGVCHHYLKNRDSTIYYAKIAEKLIKGYLGENIINHKTLYWELMMEHDYFEKNFKNSQRYADSLINYNDVNSDNGLLMNINLFKGLSYYDDNKKEIGLKYLLISDSIFDFGVQLSLQAQDKILFSTLKNHFASQGNSEMELYYLNKQIKFDSILNLKYEGLESDIIRNIETPQLLAAKNKLIQTLARQKQNAKAKTTLALIGAVILFIILLYYLKKQRIYKKKFKQLKFYESTV